MTSHITGFYAPLKDLVTYWRKRESLRKRLDNNYAKLVAAISIIRSRKDTIFSDHFDMPASTKVPTKEYEIFCEAIEEFDKRFQELQKEYEKRREDFVRDKNLCSRWKLARLSKRITRLHGDITDVEKGLNVNNVAMEKNPEDMIQTDQGYICQLPTYNEYVDKIWSHLHGTTAVRRISILGAAGVGKTTILKMLRDRLKLKVDCNVIWITYPMRVTQEEEIIVAIQDDILKLNETTSKTISPNEKCNIVSSFLSKKRYILIMDEVSSNIDLGKVGIPNDPKVQVIFAARTRFDISKMNMDIEVVVNQLPNRDGWILLESITGNIKDANLIDIGKKILDDCGGLPKVIILVAQELKLMLEVQYWRGVKRTVQSNAIFGLGGIAAAYQMAYDGLKDGPQKICSLYGALFPDNHKIYKDYLIECCKAEGFFNGKDNDGTLRAAREDGAVVLCSLIGRFILKDCSDEYVEVPIHFKKVALAHEFPGEQNGKTWVAKSLDEVSNEKNWIETRRMSLIGLLATELPAEGTSQSAANWSNLPKCPDCKNMSTLLLQLNPGLQNLEDSFFKKMEGLLLLDLHKAKIRSLPSSISYLKNLVSLYVNECVDLAILPPEIENLSNLEILDIRKTSINPWLPKEIGNLVRLRCLRISFDYKMCNNICKGKEVEEMSPSEIIGNLKELEELIIETYDCNEIWKNAASQIALALDSLEHLTTLQFNFPTVKSLHGFASARSSRNKDYKFAFFKIFVGYRKVYSPFYSDISRNLASTHLTLSFTSEETPSHVPEILKQASTFELIGHSRAKCLHELEFDKMESLKVCVVGDCSTIKSIVDANKINGMNSCLLQCLEKLLLYNLPSLEHVWKGSFLPGSFSSLTVLKVCNCPELTEIVPEILMLLEALTVLRCNKLIRLCMTRENAKKLMSIECETSWWRRLDLPEKEKFENICSFIQEDDWPMCGF